ncbi:RNA-binding protein 45-like [Pectinophora gossypiella]|uniref:RNA-binding protein 45-like n=1 Tax=Pectinophora gossypiella TaxID=13191 RepID=UPI00214E37AA|nr:RNA-binding protein 45-like [Pectinophora gossypiella]
MSNYNQNKEDVPPFSRIFIVCSKELREQDLRAPFEEHGDIEDLYMPRDRNTGDSKGVAYIKYSKTSSAAAAIHNLHLTTIKNVNKPIKVMVASNKNDKNDNSPEKHNRLFIKVPRHVTEDDITEHFSKFGKVESVYLQKDKTTNESRGLAYVQFKSFLDAALAFEECDRHYKAVFATPKQELKRGRDGQDFYNEGIHSSNNSIHKDNTMDFYNYRNDMPHHKDGINSLIRTPPQNYRSVCVTCTPVVSQKHIERLFGIVPGMQQCQFTMDSYNGYSKAFISYEDERAAAYAVEKLNNYEFPSGEIVTVKPDNPLSSAANNLTSIVNSFKNAVDSGSPDLLQLADAIAQASTLIKAATTGRMDMRVDPPSNSRQELNHCSVSLPPVQPLAGPNYQVVQRCFIVCKPQPPPNHILMDVFSRFGDLIDIATFPSKTYCFARYASVRAAQEAIATLNGACVYGMRLKVMEAEDKHNKDNDQKMNVDSDQNELMDHDGDRKRKKLSD